MTCPDADQLGRLVEDKLGAEDRIAIEDHLDNCDDCRATVAMLVRTATADRRSGDRSRFEGSPEGYAETLVAQVSETALESGASELRSSARTPLPPGTT